MKPGDTNRCSTGGRDSAIAPPHGIRNWTRIGSS